MSSNETMIRVKTETREKLLSVGKKGQTYDDVIQQLLENNQKKESVD